MQHVEPTGAASGRDAHRWGADRIRASRLLNLEILTGGIVGQRTLITPCRGAAQLSDGLKPISPGPVRAPPFVTVIQGASGSTVHEHPACVVTVAVSTGADMHGVNSTGVTE